MALCPRLCDFLCYDILATIYNYMVKRHTREGVTTMKWDYCGFLHQEKGKPALIRSDGHCEYWYMGRLHRSYGYPAITFNPKFEIKDFSASLGLRIYEKRVEYWVKGELHRDDGPAVIIGDGVEDFEYYDSNKRKFERIMLAGTIKFFYRNGVLYRPHELPVIEASNALVYREDSEGIQGYKIEEITS